MPHFIKYTADLIKKVTNELIALNRLYRGLKFNGTSNYITFGRISDMEFQRADNFSISTWVYIPNSITGSGTVYLPILSYLDNVNNNSSGYSLYIGYSASTGIFTLTFQHQTNGSVYMYSQCAVTNGLHQIVFTKNGTTPSTNFKFYVDNELVSNSGSGSNWTSGTLTYTSNFSNFIGYGVVNVASLIYTQIHIFDVKIFNKALSTTEIKNDFESDGLTYPKADSLHVWDFNEKSGLTLLDRKGSSNGTLQYTVGETTLGAGNFHIDAINFNPITA